MPLSKDGLVIVPYRSNDKAGRSIKNINKITHKAIRQAAFRSGKELVKHAKTEILKKGNRSGHIYKIRRGSTTRLHQASAAGEYPASISGDLWRSLGFEMQGSSSMVFGAGKVGLNDAEDYARILELGGVAGVIGSGFSGKRAVIAPRKYLKQTIDKNDHKISLNINLEMLRKFKAL